MVNNFRVVLGLGLLPGRKYLSSEARYGGKVIWLKCAGGENFHDTYRYLSMDRLSDGSGYSAVKGRCIAATCIQHGVRLLHNDRDFELINSQFSLQMVV